MPWCADCDRYLSPSTVREDGTCPTCGRAVDPGAAGAAGGAVSSGAPATEEALPPIPWHLKLLALAVAVYLAFRLYQGVVWLLG